MGRHVRPAMVESQDEENPEKKVVDTSLETVLVY
jgi:hypothetical protein